MGKYEVRDKALAVCHWVFPEGGEISRAGLYEHDDLLSKVEAIDYDPEEANHGQAFDLGFLRVTVARSELNLQWASTLTGHQRRRAIELMEGCGAVEISGADCGYNPEGNFYNLTLETSDSIFRRQFAAGLRRNHSEWVDCDC